MDSCLTNQIGLFLSELAPAASEGAIWYGMNSGAKKSLDTNYLAAATATGRVDIRPLHVVTGISRDGRAYRVEVDRLDGDTGAVVESLVLRAARYPGRPALRWLHRRDGIAGGEGLLQGLVQIAVELFVERGLGIGLGHRSAPGAGAISSPLRQL